MKCFAALLALVAVASGKSFYPGLPFTGYHAGVAPFLGAHQGVLPYNFAARVAPGFPHQGFYNPIYTTTAQQQRVFKREADSDSDSFFPGYPFVTPNAFGAYGATPFGVSPYNYGVNPYNYGVNPYMVRPAGLTYATHPMVYNPLIKLAEDKQEEDIVVEREKRESDSDSFYPGYGYMPSAAFGAYGVNPYTAGFGTPYTTGLPSVVPRVLPYTFPGNYYQGLNPLVRTYRPVVAVEQEQKAVEEV